MENYGELCGVIPVPVTPTISRLYINRDYFQYPESLLKMSVNGNVICKCIPLPRSMPGPNTVCSDNVLCTNTEYKMHLCILNSIWCVVALWMICHGVDIVNDHAVYILLQWNALNFLFFFLNVHFRWWLCNFTARRYAYAVLAVVQCLRPSVHHTCVLYWNGWRYDQTFPQQGSPIILVFNPSDVRNSTRNSLSEGVKYTE